MHEHVPAWLGHLIRDHRAGHDKLVAADPDIRLGAERGGERIGGSDDLERYLAG